MLCCAVSVDEHRTIALISHASKILSRLAVILNRMKSAAEEQITDVQMGFRKEVGRRHQIFNLRIIIEKAREAPVLLYITFIDYKKAFESVKAETQHSVEDTERHGPLCHTHNGEHTKAAI